MAADAVWLRLNVDWDESKWLADLPWPVRAVWTVVITYVKKEGRAGRCKAPIIKRFAGLKDIPEEFITALLSRAVEDGAMEVTDNEWIITNWSTYQPVDRTNSERQAKHRAKTKDDAQVQSGINNAVMVDESNTHNGVTLSRDTTDHRQDTNPPSPTEMPPQGGRARRDPPMVVPTDEELAGYFREIGGTGAMGRAFRDFYASNGWKVGKNPMKDWRAAARNWLRTEQKREEAKARSPNGAKPSGTAGTFNHLLQGSELAKQLQIPQIPT